MIASILTEQQIREIHAQTLQVLERTGVRFWNSPRALQVLAKAGCAVREERVFFPPEVVNWALGALPDREALAMHSPEGGRTVSLASRQVNFSTVGNAYYVYDFQRGEQRDIEVQDVEQYWVLFENLEHFAIRVGELILRSWRHGGQQPISARCETAEQAIACFRDLHERKRVPAKPIITSIGRTREQVRIGILQSLLYRSSLADLQQRPTTGVWVNPLSPLQYDDQTEGIVEGAQQGIPIMISPEIMGGSTGPITLAGILVQQNAEVLAGLVLAQATRPATTVIYGSLSGPMDPRVADISMGSIEANVVQCATVQIADFYGLPSRIAAGNTGAKAPGPRAVTEAALGVFMGAAAGANIITTGLLDCTLMLSYEHMALLDEIMGAVKRACRGVDIDEARFALSEIHREGKPGGSYLTSAHTLEHLRGELFLSDFFGRAADSYEDWYQHAHRKVRRLFDTKAKVDFGRQVT
ncbi:MAG: trimethylamine methyltransferase family protein, partial [Candidatus Eisenbacteria bacterium]|nr:trimethylamine methyltransferase family protein [Candidatus Eisenbacteria bacterium]